MAIEHWAIYDRKIHYELMRDTLISESLPFETGLPLFEYGRRINLKYGTAWELFLEGDRSLSTTIVLYKLPKPKRTSEGRLCRYFVSIVGPCEEVEEISPKLKTALGLEPLPEAWESYLDYYVEELEILSPKM
jgi:hypothetical protein